MAEVVIDSNCLHDMRNYIAPKAATPAVNKPACGALDRRGQVFCWLNRPAGLGLNGGPRNKQDHAASGQINTRSKRRRVISPTSGRPQLRRRQYADAEVLPAEVA